MCLSLPSIDVLPRSVIRRRDGWGNMPDNPIPKLAPAATQTKQSATVAIRRGPFGGNGGKGGVGWGGSFQWGGRAGGGGGGDIGAVFVHV